MLLRFALLVSLLAAPASVPIEAFEVGQTVFIKDGAQGKNGNNEDTVVHERRPDQIIQIIGRWHLVGDYWIQSEDLLTTDEALEHYSRLIEAKPSASLYLFRASVWKAKEEFTKAIEDCTQAIKLAPQNAEAHSQRALFRGLQGDRAASIKDYTESLRLDPKNAESYFMRGLLWKDEGQRDKALKDFTSAIELLPEVETAYVYRGRTWHEKGNYKEAVKDYSQAISLHPESYMGFLGRGRSFSRMGKYKEALQDYSTAMKIDYSDFRAWNNRAWFKATCPDEDFRDAQQAVIDATMACKITDFKHPSCLSTLAAAYAEFGDFENAVKWQKTAIKLAPESESEALRKRLKLYESGQPYREPMGE